MPLLQSTAALPISFVSHYRFVEHSSAAPNACSLYCTQHHEPTSACSDTPHPAHFTKVTPNIFAHVAVRRTRTGRQGWPERHVLHGPLSHQFICSRRDCLTGRGGGVNELRCEEQQREREGDVCALTLLVGPERVGICSMRCGGGLRSRPAALLLNSSRSLPRSPCNARFLCNMTAVCRAKYTFWGADYNSEPVCM